MVAQVKVFYEGWGERWHWGTLAMASEPHSPILFEYSEEALRQGLELSALYLPLSPRAYSDFPSFNEHLPGVLADALPDGWGRLLMDRLFRQRGLDPNTVTVLERLTYISDTAMGAFSFHPEVSITDKSTEEIPLDLLARETQAVLAGEDTELLAQLVDVGGSPQGARPKALVYRNSASQQTSTVAFTGAEPWLIKFPARAEHAEVCAIEYLYAACAFQCGIEVPEVEYFDLGAGLAAFAAKRFDRQGDLRIPMHSLAGYLNTDFRIPNCDYDTFIRATGHITSNNMQEIQKAFVRTVFNVVFNNRDDHTKNFSYVLNEKRQWVLAPAYDLTYNEGPKGYHQMSVMGEAQAVSRSALVALAKVAHIPEAEAKQIIERCATVANQFSALCHEYFDGVIRIATIKHIQKALARNISAISS